MKEDVTPAIERLSRLSIAIRLVLMGCLGYGSFWLASWVVALPVARYYGLEMAVVANDKGLLGSVLFVLAGVTVLFHERRLLDGVEDSS